MIVRPRPGPFELLFALLALLLALAERRYPDTFLRVTASPFTVLGLALSIFLGFRNNACHARWGCSAC